MDRPRTIGTDNAACAIDDDFDWGTACKGRRCKLNGMERTGMLIGVELVPVITVRKDSPTETCHVKLHEMDVITSGCVQIELRSNCHLRTPVFRCDHYSDTSTEFDIDSTIAFSGKRMWVGLGHLDRCVDLSATEEFVETCPITVLAKSLTGEPVSVSIALRWKETRRQCS